MQTIFNDPITISDEVRDDIILIQQYFLHKDNKRHNENLKCLDSNVKNDYIKKIYFLNERIYSKSEMNNIESNKIEQVNINKRLSYYDFFKFCKEKALSGYIIVANLDIFFNDTLVNLFKTTLSQRKSCFSQLRLEYPSKKIFGPRNDSQDAWIFHSKYLPELSTIKKYDFMLGMPGCDNKIIHLLNSDGYKIYNEPYRIETVHVHTSQIRNYTRKDLVPPPYKFVKPYLSTYYGKSKQIDMPEFYQYIKGSIENNNSFYIPQIGGIEHDISFRLLIRKQTNNQDIHKLRINAGIGIHSNNDYTLYNEMYIKSLISSEIYINWPNNSNVANTYKTICETNNLLRKDNVVSANLLIPYNAILERTDNFFSRALNGKRILIISPNVDNMEKQVTTYKELFGDYKLFPECSFVFIKSPSLNDSNVSWFKQYLILCKLVNNVKDSFDVALCSCNGFGNLIAHHIHSRMNKSAINMGSILQVYFGIINRQMTNDDVKKITEKYNTKWVFGE